VTENAQFVGSWYVAIATLELNATPCTGTRVRLIVTRANASMSVGLRAANPPDPHSARA